MKVTTFARLAIAGGVIAVAASSLVVTPAFADPVSPNAPSATALVGLGSDTTQDVMDELSTVIGQDKLVSYTSTVPGGGAATAIQTRPAPYTANVVRAKGSGDGWSILKVAEGSAASGTAANFTTSGIAINKANTVGQIDYARASATQGTASATGEYVDIPFARDVVGIAVNPTDAVSKIPLTLGTSTDAATVPSIQNIFRCKTKYVYLNNSGNTYNSVGAAAGDAPADTTAYQIKPVLPAYGSGTAKFFIGALGLTEAAGLYGPTGTYTCVSRVMADGTTPIQEHDGSSVSETTNALGIYSIGQFVVQKKGTVTDKTHSTTLLNVDTIAPTTGSGATLAPNADNWVSALKRFVYNIVAYRKAIDPTNAINRMFVGSGSLVCQNSASITKMGFAPLTASDGGDPTSNANSCGSINNANRYTAGSDGAAMGTPATVTNAAAVPGLATTVGDAFTVAVNGGVATHDMGGKVVILDAGYGNPSAHILGTATIDAGTSITANVQVTPIAAGSTKLYAYFIPALGGIKVTNMSPVSGSDASFATINPASVNRTTTKLSVKKATTLGGTDRVIAWVSADVDLPGGTVELSKVGDDARSFTGVTSGAINTFTLANTVAGAAFTKTAAAVHGLVSGNPVKFSGTCPAGITVGNTYYVSATALTTTAFKVSTVAGGAVVATTAASGTSCVVTAQTPTVFTATAAHGLAVGNRVKFSTGTLPTGFVSGTNYFIASVPSTTTFTLAVTSGGAGIAATANGTGTYTVLNTTPRASGTLAAGENAEVLSITQDVATLNLKAKFIPADNSVLGSESSTTVVTIAKATPTLATVTTLPAAPNGFVAGTSPVFANAAKTVKIGTTAITVNASTDVITTPVHGLAVNDVVYFGANSTSAATAPSGLTKEQAYYVLTVPSTTTMTVSATRGGDRVDITATTAPVNIAAFKSNVAPKFSATVTAPTGVTITPTGSVRVYIGTSPSDKSHEITSDSTGLTLAAGTVAGQATLTGTLSKASTWTWVNAGNLATTTGVTAYLIIDYVGDDAFATATLNKQIKVTP